MVGGAAEGVSRRLERTGTGGHPIRRRVKRQRVDTTAIRGQPARAPVVLEPEYASHRIYGAVAYLKAYQGVGRTCRASGPVRDSCHRQQRQHHQPGGVHAAHVWSPEHGTQPPIARSRPPFVSKWPSPDGEYAEQEPHEPQARTRV